jgi:outer membrane protein OmpA-like peptidoglycan-associated protein
MHARTKAASIAQTATMMTAQPKCGACENKKDRDPSLTQRPDHLALDFSLVPIHANREVGPRLTHPLQRARAEAEAERMGGRVGASILESGRVGPGPLPKSLRSTAETHLGVDLDGLTLESGDTGGAAAVTEGDRIRFAAGRLDLADAFARRLLGHELTHAAQQRVWGVRTPQYFGDCGDASTPTAKHADDTGGKVFSSQAREELPVTPADRNDPRHAQDPNLGLTLFNFCVGKPTLRPEHVLPLREAAASWKRTMVGPSSTSIRRGDLRVQILGAAGPSEGIAKRSELALARAAVVRALLIDEGIPADRIVSAEDTSVAALAEGVTQQEQERDRRVEVFLFTPTREVSTAVGVAASVRNISIGRHPKGLGYVETGVGDDSAQRGQYFGHFSGAMLSEADVDLTGFQGTSVGFFQVLNADTRIAQYVSEDGAKRSTLDWSHCMGSILPCRDTTSATSRFSADDKILMLDHTGGVQGKVSLNDSPGFGVPLRYFLRNEGRFTLTHFVWSMRFQVILGVRDDHIFEPVRQTTWGLVISRAVDVAWDDHDKLTRLATKPGSTALMHGEWVSGATGLDLTTIMTRPTCRQRAREISLPGEDNPCLPVERRF